MKLSAVVAITLWSFLAMGQQVHVSQSKNDVVLSVWAQKPYPLMSGEGKVAALSLECILKSKKITHILKFLPGGTLAEDNPEPAAKGEHLTFNMTIDGTKQMTTWVPYGDAVTFVYFGSTEPERMKFIQSLLTSAIVEIEFTPFLTGVPTTSVFDLSKLRQEVTKYPECAMQ